MELVAVEPHVDVVERAHGRPAVLVGKADRDDTVGLHLGRQRLEGIEIFRNLVALLRPEALAVEETPRVVVVRHEVHLAVRAGGGFLQGIREISADLLPDIIDGSEEALAGVELHPVAREPGERVVRRALQVGVDLVLEVVVRHHVGVNGLARLFVKASVTAW